MIVVNIPRMLASQASIDIQCDATRSIHINARGDDGVRASGATLPQGNLLQRSIR